MVAVYKNTFLSVGLYLKGIILYYASCCIIMPISKKAVGKVRNCILRQISLICTVSTAEDLTSENQLLWRSVQLKNSQPPRLSWPQIQPSLWLISLYCMSANSNLTCVTFRHNLLLLQHFGRGSIRRIPRISR